jgi:hypothetical protein
MCAVIAWKQGGFDLLRQIDWSQYTCAMLEAPGWARFVETRIGDWIKEEVYEGVAFKKDREIRWLRRDNGGFHLVMIDDGNHAPEGWVQSTLTPTGETSTILLWNPQDSRIPWPATTPPPRGGRPLRVGLRHYTLTVRRPHWMDRDEEKPAKEVELFRCSEIIEEQHR